MEVNSTRLITTKLANEHARKVLFTCVVYSNCCFNDQSSNWTTWLNISVTKGSSSASNVNNCYTLHDVASTWNEARDTCRYMGAHLVTMETTDKWNKVKAWSKKKWRRPIVSITITLDSVEKVECGNGPSESRLMPPWQMMTVAERLASPHLIVTQGNSVSKSGIPQQGSKGLMTSDVIVHIYILDIGRNWTLPLGFFRTNFTIFALGEVGRQLI